MTNVIADSAHGRCQRRFEKAWLSNIVTTAIMPDRAGTSSILSTRYSDSRGLTTPLGTSGVVYLRSASDTTAVTAVSVSAAAGIQTWSYRGGGQWQ